jgi:hypothetical protein
MSNEELTCDFVTHRSACTVPAQLGDCCSHDRRSLICLRPIIDDGSNSQPIKRHTSQHEDAVSLNIEPLVSFHTPLTISPRVYNFEGIHPAWKDVHGAAPRQAASNQIWTQSNCGLTLHRTIVVYSRDV